MYIEEPQDIIFKKKLFSISETRLIIANSADHDKMLHYAAIHQGLHCLSKYQIRNIQSPKG